MRYLLKAVVLILIPCGAVLAANGAAEKHWRLAKEYLDKGWSHHAREEAKVVLSLDPEHEAARELLRSGVETGAPFASARRRTADGPADLFSQARLAYRESRVEDARKLADQILMADPAHEGAAGMLAKLDEEVYRPSPLGANDVLREIFHQGIALLRKEEWEASTEVLERALVTEPSHDQIRMFHGRARARAEEVRTERGLRNAETAIAEGREAAAREALVGVLALRPDCARAKALLDSLGGSEVDPERAEKAKVHFNRGVEAYERGMWAEAVREWDMVVTLNPSDKEAKRLLKKARGKMTRAAKDNEKRAAALHSEALKLYQQGKMEEAAGTFRRILEINPGDEKARRSLDLIEGKASQ